MIANGFLLAPVSEIRKFLYCLLSDEELRAKIQDDSARLGRKRAQNHLHWDSKDLSRKQFGSSSWVDKEK